jgi:hypothetical protein
MVEEYQETQVFNEEDLATLIRTNQSLLRALDVSHKSLEEICHITKLFGAETKLTGAGGGGCAFTFVPVDANKSKKDEIRNALQKSRMGFSCMESTVGGTGVVWEEKLPIMSMSRKSKLLDHWHIVAGAVAAGSAFAFTMMLSRRR